MRTQTSKTRIWLSTLLLIPIFGLLLVSFTTKKEVLIDNSNLSSQQINSNPTFIEFILDMESQDARFYLDDNPITVDKAKSIARNNKGKQTEMLTQKDDNGTYIVKLYTVSKSEYARSIEVEVLGNNAYLIDGNRATKTSFRDAFDQLHQDISKEVRSKVINIHVTSTETLSNDEVWFIYNALEDYGYHRIVTKNQEIVRSKGNTPFATENHPSVSNTQLKIQEGATKQQMDEYNRLAKSYNSQPEGRRIVKMKDYKRMKYIYDLMSPEQRKAAQPLPKLPPPPPRAMHKGKVNDGIFNKYNKWIRGLKNSDGTYKQISSGEQKYYQSIYDNMTDDQKKRSAGLPPPPPPPRPKTIKVKETPPPPPPPKPAIAEKVTKKVQEVPPPPPKPVVVEVVEVPPPPPPPEPLEYVKSMAESNAIFYYEGKRISAKEAISIVRKNESINLKTKKSDTRTPEVYLSKRPMVKEIKRN